MSAHTAIRKGIPAGRYARAGLAVFVLALILASALWPHFWLTADQWGDILLVRKQFAEAARTYADPWRIGTARYRNGDFEAAAKTFARVPGGAGAFNEANARLMHGQYDLAIEAYDRALELCPGWKAAEENRVLAAARKAKLESSGEDRHTEQTDAYTPDKLVFDQKGGEKREAPMDMNGERMTDESMRSAWLRRVRTTPGDFLRAKFAYQASQPAEKVAESQEQK